MNHSQKLNEKPLTLWLIALESGNILAAHCDCAAGLGETCSHVGSLPWVIGVGVESRDLLTVTQKSGYWVMPPAIRSIPYAPLKDFDFIGRRGSHANLEQLAVVPHLRSQFPKHQRVNRCSSSMPWALCPGAKPAVLAVTPGYYDAYVPASLAPESILL